MAKQTKPKMVKRKAEPKLMPEWNTPLKSILKKTWNYKEKMLEMVSKMPNSIESNLGFNPDQRLHFFIDFNSLETLYKNATKNETKNGLIAFFGIEDEGNRAGQLTASFLVLDSVGDILADHKIKEGESGYLPGQESWDPPPPKGTGKSPTSSVYLTINSSDEDILKYFTSPPKI